MSLKGEGGCEGVSVNVKRESEFEEMRVSVKG